MFGDSSECEARCPGAGHSLTTARIPCSLVAMSTEPTLSATTAEEIQVMLVRRRMSKSGLARMLGVSHTWVNNRLNGQQEIGLNELQRIAATLDVELTDLLPPRREGRILPTGERSPVTPAYR